MIRNSRKLFRLTLPLAVMALSVALTSGCAKKQKPDEISPSTDMGEKASVGDSDSGRALGLVTIRFPYDSFSLNDAAKEALKNNASILKDKAAISVQIEGHCDSRGGVQYNIALGEKRAKAVGGRVQGNQGER
ncbi:hypothetical protein EBZ37_10895, partial [bacterium]|nr:hypothetical protein [bacterium]